MRKALLALSISAFAATGAFAGEAGKVYSWVDENGQRHFGDSIPPEYAELDKELLNDRGIQIDTLEGRKSPEQIAEEKRLEEERIAKEAQRRADRALLATYLTRDEIIMHRDRRVELFQAQARVTEMFLKNLQRRLAGLIAEANQYQPYSDNPDAPAIDPDLDAEIKLTRDTIARHEGNLEKFKRDERAIIRRFDQDLKRFEELKGLIANTG